MRERPIKNVAIESYLYSHKDHDGKYNHALENELKLLEDKASRAIESLSGKYKYALRKKPKAIEIDNTVVASIIDLLIWQIKRHPDIVNELKLECVRYLQEQGRSADDAKAMALAVVKNIGASGKCEIKEELERKNKIILCTSIDEAHFITTDKPFVRFNKHGPNGIAVDGTEMYYPITSNMLLFMCGNGTRREFRLENHRAELRKVNIFMARAASNYIFGKSDKYIKKVVKGIGLTSASRRAAKVEGLCKVKLSPGPGGR